MNLKLAVLLLITFAIIGGTGGYQLGKSDENQRMNKFYAENLSPKQLTKIVSVKSDTSMPYSGNAEWLTKRDLLKAIATVESGSPFRDNDILGDGGAALGPLQIHTKYHRDAKDVDGKLNFYDSVSEWDYSVRTFNAYMKRYANSTVYNSYVSDLMTLHDCEHVARIHNGGPYGHKSAKTKRYWSKVRQYLVNQQ